MIHSGEATSTFSHEPHPLPLKFPSPLPSLPLTVLLRHCGRYVVFQSRLSNRFSFRCSVRSSSNFKVKASLPLPLLVFGSSLWIHLDFAKTSYSSESLVRWSAEYDSWIQFVVEWAIFSFFTLWSWFYLACLLNFWSQVSLRCVISELLFFFQFTHFIWELCDFNLVYTVETMVFCLWRETAPLITHQYWFDWLLQFCVLL